MFGASKYLIVIFSVITLLLSGVTIFLYNKTEILTSSLAKIEIALTQSQKENEKLRGIFKESQEKIKNLNDKIVFFSSQAEIAKKRLDSFRSRLEDAALKKPSLIEKKTNDSWRKGLLDLENTTKGVRND